MSKTQSWRYRVLLKAIASGVSRWSMIKRYLEAVEGVEIDDKTFNNLLQRLVKTSIVEKRNNEYHIIDPIIRQAIINKL